MSKDTNKNSSNIELKYMTVPFKISASKETKEADGQEFFEFEGYGSAFGNVDEGDDMMMPGACAESIAEAKAGGQMPPVLWQHKSNEPVGIYADMFEDTQGLFVKGKLPKSDTFVSGRVIPQMKCGSVRKLSIGYSTKDCHFEEIDGKSIRKLDKVKIWEISLVTFPMNNQANVTSMKALDFSNVSKLSDVEDMLKSKGFTDKESKTLISKITEIKKIESDSQSEKSVISASDLQELKNAAAGFASIITK